MTRELDERQEALHKVNTLDSRPVVLEPSRHRWRMRTKRERFWIWIKSLVLRRRA